MSASTLTDICLLIVDDDPNVRDILQVCFEEMGAVAVTADSAEEAMFLFQRLRPQMVLTDIAMPVHDGFWLLGQLRALERSYTQTPVIAMTASHAPVGSAVRAKFDGWIEKPFDFAELVTLVEQQARARKAA